MTPDERATYRRERDRLTRELKERIEYHRARLAAAQDIDDGPAAASTQ